MDQITRAPMARCAGGCGVAQPLRLPPSLGPRAAGLGRRRRRRWRLRGRRRGGRSRRHPWRSASSSAGASTATSRSEVAATDSHARGRPRGRSMMQQSWRHDLNEIAQRGGSWCKRRSVRPRGTRKPGYWFALGGCAVNNEPTCRNKDGEKVSSRCCPRSASSTPVNELASSAAPLHLPRQHSSQ